MPQIIVKANGETDRGDELVMMRERVSAADFESDRFSANLVERLGWAVLDAAQAERDETLAPDETARLSRGASPA